MFSKKNTLVVAMMLYRDDVFQEEDIIQIIMDQNWKNPLIPCWKYNHVEATLGDMSEAELKAEFRFGSCEINLLYEALRIPESFTSTNRTVATGLEGLFMFLKCIAYPCHLGDMIPWFGR